jgi:hypothetical protein
MDIANSKQIKTQSDGLTILTTYFYYIEDSIIRVYKTTIEYLYPPIKPKYEQSYGEFEIIEPTDYEENNSMWFGHNLMTSIRNSLYVPTIDYTYEELENLGYKPLSENQYFKDTIWNCMIYSDNRKFEILLELINIWKLNKINIHIISGPYEHNEFELFTQLSNDMPCDTEVTFHNTYLHDFNKESLLNFIRKNPKEFKFWKTDGDRINLTVLNCPQFEVDSEIYTEIVGDKKNLIVFDDNLDRFNIFMDYVAVPSKHITKCAEVTNTKYPMINTDNDMYAVYSHSDCDSLARQLNYLRLW